MDAKVNTPFGCDFAKFDLRWLPPIPRRFTTQRYAPFDADPLRRTSNVIGAALDADLDGRMATGNVVPLKC